MVWKDNVLYSQNSEGEIFGHLQLVIKGEKVD